MQTFAIECYVFCCFTVDNVSDNGLWAPTAQIFQKTVKSRNFDTFSGIFFTEYEDRILFFLKSDDLHSDPLEKLHAIDDAEKK